MQLLLGSKNASSDRETFFSSQIIFYLLAAIDGHAKNFSVFIEPNGTYCLTPLYDIMSAFPLMANKQLHKQKIKMAMALIGKNKHYHWHKIQRRHFMSTAQAANFSVEKAEFLLDEILTKTNDVITRVKNSLPKGFPKHIYEPIFQGMLIACRCLRKRS